MNACVAASPAGGAWIEWSWRDMGFICHPDEAQAYENGFGLVPTIALGVAFVVVVVWFIRRQLRMHPSSAVARAGRMPWFAAALIVVFAAAHVVALIEAYETEFFTVLLLSVGLANVIAAVLVARWWRTTSVH